VEDPGEAHILVKLGDITMVLEAVRLKMERGTMVGTQ
jgi:hypothetical protein